MVRYIKSSNDNINASVERDYEGLALQFGEAIKDLASNDEALKNFVSYLTYSFPKWCTRFASTPEGLVSEFRNFADM